MSRSHLNTRNLLAGEMILTTSPLILPPEPISVGRRYGCPLCAHLERGDILVGIPDHDSSMSPVSINPVWIAPTHTTELPPGFDWTLDGYRVLIAHGHVFVDSPNQLSVVGQSQVETLMRMTHEVDLPDRLSNLLGYYQPQNYAHHRQLAPLYWSLVAVGERNILTSHYRTRTRVLTGDDELRAFYGRVVLASSLTLFAKWEFLGHDFDVRWAKNVPIKYHLIRSNLIANPELPYSWPISAELTVNPPQGVHDLGGGHGQYLATVTELLDGQTVTSHLTTLPGDRLYRVGIECLALLHEAHYGSQPHHWMHLDPHLDNFLLGRQVVGINRSGPGRRIHLTTTNLVLTEPLWLIDYNSAYFPELPTEFVSADFAYANEREGWWKQYTTINPAWDAIYFLRNYWWLIAERRPELLEQVEFQRFLLTSLAAIPEQLLQFAGQLNPLDSPDEIQQWFYSLLGRSVDEVQSMVVDQARVVLNRSNLGDWVRAWFGHHRGVSYIGQRRLSIGNGTIGDLLEDVIERSG